MAIRGIDLWRSSGQSRRLKSSCHAGSPYPHLMANAGTGTASVAIFAATPEPHSSNDSQMPRPKAANEGIDCLALHLLPSSSESPGMQEVSLVRLWLATARRGQIKTGNCKGTEKL